MNNSLNNPGEVLYDYLSSSRYGANLTDAQIDIPSITGTANTQMKGYCNELVAYTDNANVSQTNTRYQINGMVSTFDVASTNIDKICQSSATFFTFNPKKGKFAAIPNRALATEELANALIYNDDNIVSKIDISSTELYSLYNGVEITFADQNRKDQTNSIKVTTPSGDRNANEPDNTLTYNLDLLNDNVRATRLANIDLNQSRVGTVIQFVADFSGIQSDVGDVIKLTSNLYDWTDKLFRVMRVTEVQDQGGMVTAQITALEYTADYYSVPAVTESAVPPVIDLPRLPIIPPIYIPDVYNGNYANVSALSGGVFGNAISNPAMKTFGAGVQIEDANLTNNVIANSSSFNNITTPAEYDISDSDIGDYSFDAFGTPGGTVSGPYNLGFKTAGNITFANATTTSTFNIGGGGQSFTGFSVPVSTLTSQTKFSTDPTDASYGLPADYKAQSVNVAIQGYSTLDDSISERQFGNMKYQVIRVTKGEK